MTTPYEVGRYRVEMEARDFVSPEANSCQGQHVLSCAQPRWHAAREPTQRSCCDGPGQFPRACSM